MHKASHFNLRKSLATLSNKMGYYITDSMCNFYRLSYATQVVTTVFSRELVLYYSAYHLLLDDGEGLESLQHFDIELSQVAIVEHVVDVSERNKGSHSEIRRKQSVG